jgi:hypothetical protein
VDSSPSTVDPPNWSITRSRPCIGAGQLRVGATPVLAGQEAVLNEPSHPLVHTEAPGRDPPPHRGAHPSEPAHADRRPNTVQTRQCNPRPLPDRAPAPIARLLPQPPPDGAPPRTAPRSSPTTPAPTCSTPRTINCACSTTPQPPCARPQPVTQPSRTTPFGAGARWPCQSSAYPPVRTECQAVGQLRPSSPGLT